MIFFIKKLLTPLNNLNNVVETLASSEGDLRQRLDVEHKDEFGHVSLSINKFIEKLHEIRKSLKPLAMKMLLSQKSFHAQHLKLSKM